MLAATPWSPSHRSVATWPGEVDGETADAVERLERLNRTGTGYDGRSLGREQASDGEADALAGAGDDRDLAGEREVHQLAPFSSRTPSSQLSIAAATSSAPSPTTNRCGRPSNSM